MIWFLRHGQAEGSADDDSRELTDKGRRQAENAGGAMVALGARLDACLTSPTARARATAVLACRPLGVEPEVVEALRSGGFDAEALAAGRDQVLLVSHKPVMLPAIQWATGGLVKLKMGGLAAISDGELCRLMTPRDLELLANEGVARAVGSRRRAERVGSVAVRRPGVSSR